MSPRRRTRFLRRRPTRAPRPAIAWLAGVLTLALIGGFIYVAETSYNGLPLVNYRYLNVQLPNIGHLQQHNAVEIAGVRVGQVLSTSTRDNEALVKLQLQGVGPIPVNSRVIIRADGLLGERYAELELGKSKRTLPNGGRIVESGDTYYNGIPETLNLFDQETRTSLGEMLNGFGEGVTGRGEGLNQAIGVGAASGANFDTTAQAILDRPGAAAALLPDTNSGLNALNQARNDIAKMLGPTAKGLKPFQTERTQVQNAISDAPSVEQSIDAGFSAPGTNLLVALDDVAHSADAVLPVAPTAFGSATRLLKAAVSPLQETDTTLRAVPPASRSTLSMLAALKPDLHPLNQAFTNLVDPVTNLAEHGCDIRMFSANVRSLVSYGTEPGGGLDPDIGFPLTPVVSTQILNEQANFGSYPYDVAYPAPCADSPGPTINQNTLAQALLSGFDL